MTWTAPATATGSQVVSPAFWNAQIPNNFLAQDVAVVEEAGDLVYATGPNEMGGRLPIGGVRSVLVADGAPKWGSVAQSLVAMVYSIFISPSGFQRFDEPLYWGNGDTVTAFPPVEVTLETGAEAMLWYGARFVQNSTLGAQIQLSYSVAGASSIAASNVWGTVAESDPGTTLRPTGRSHLATGLTPGVNTFRLEGNNPTVGGAGTVSVPFIIVRAL